MIGAVSVVPMQKGLIASWARIYNAILQADNEQIEKLRLDHEKRLGFTKEPVESTEIIISKACALSECDLKVLIKRLTVGVKSTPIKSRARYKQTKTDYLVDTKLLLLMSIRDMDSESIGTNSADYDALCVASGVEGESAKDIAKTARKMPRADLELLIDKLIMTRNI